MGRFFYIQSSKNKIKLKNMKFPQKPGSIISHYYIQDLIDFNNLTGAGENLIANCSVLNPDNVVILSKEILEQNQEIQNSLEIKGPENSETILTNTSQSLQDDQIHLKIKEVAGAILSKLAKINKPAYIMQFPIELDSEICTVIDSSQFNQLNYKQNLNHILATFAPKQRVVKSQEELLEQVQEIQKASQINKIVLKNPTIEGGMGVQIITNLTSISKNQTIEKIEKLGNSKCYLIEEFLEGTEYSTQFSVENGLIIPVNHSLQIIDNGKHQGNILSNSFTKPNKHMQKLISLLTPYFKGYSGLFGVDYIIKNQGDLKVLEINPRFTGNSVGSLVCSSFTEDFTATSIQVKYDGISSDLFTQEVIQSASNSLPEFIDSPSGVFPIQWGHAGNLGQIKFLIKAPSQDELQTILVQNFSANPNLDLTIQTLNQI